MFWAKLTPRDVLPSGQHYLTRLFSGNAINCGFTNKYMKKYCVKNNYPVFKYF